MQVPLLLSLLLVSCVLGQPNTPSTFSATVSITDPAVQGLVTGTITWSSTLGKQRIDYDAGFTIINDDAANIAYKRCPATSCEPTAWNVPQLQFAYSTAFQSSGGNTWTQATNPSSLFVKTLVIANNLVTQATTNTGVVYRFTNIVSLDAGDSPTKNTLNDHTNWNCPTTTCNQPVDAILVLDMSGSIDNTQWGQMVSFCQSFASSFTFGPTATRMGLVWFGNDGYAKTFPSGDGKTPGLLTDARSFSNAINTTRPSRAESSCIGCGYQVASRMFGTPRSGVPQIMLVLSDGHNNVPNVQDRSCWLYENGGCSGSGGRSDGSGASWLVEAPAIKQKYPGLTIFGVGVVDTKNNDRPISTDIMVEISTSDKTYVVVGDYNQLAQSVQKLTTFTCPATAASNCPCKGGICGCAGQCLCPTCTNTTCSTSVCTKPSLGCNAPQDRICTTDKCHSVQCDPSKPIGQGCVETLLECTDKPCLKSSCDSQRGCQYADNTATVCQAQVADYSASCTTCNPSNGKCTTDTQCKCTQFTPRPAPNKCLVDNCFSSNGTIAFIPVNCDDRNSCTDDTCDPNSGCIHTTRTCDDSDLCTTDSCDDTKTYAEACQNTPINVTAVCDDLDLCTDDVCTPSVGCQHNTKVCPSTGLKCDNTTCDPLFGCTTLPMNCTAVGNFSLLIGDCHTAACNETVGCFLALVEGGATDACGFCSGDVNSALCKLTPAVIAGITAGAIAGIAVGGAAAAGVLGFAGKKGYDYFASGAMAAGGVQNNPMYVGGSTGGANPMFEGTSA